MTINEAISAADRIREGNAYSDREKISWLNAVDGAVNEGIIKRHVKPLPSEAEVEEAARRRAEAEVLIATKKIPWQNIIAEADTALDESMTLYDEAYSLYDGDSLDDYITWAVSGYKSLGTTAAKLEALQNGLTDVTEQIGSLSDNLAAYKSAKNGYEAKLDAAGAFLSAACGALVNVCEPVLSEFVTVDEDDMNDEILERISLTALEAPGYDREMLIFRAQEAYSLIRGYLYAVGANIDSVAGSLDGTYDGDIDAWLNAYAAETQQQLTTDFMSAAADLPADGYDGEIFGGIDAETSVITTYQIRKIRGIYDDTLPAAQKQYYVPARGDELNDPIKYFCAMEKAAEAAIPEAEEACAQIEKDEIRKARDEVIQKYHYFGYDQDTDADHILLIPEPWSQCYVFYLLAQIDFFNQESFNYNNNMARFNAELQRYSDWYNKNHKPTGAAPGGERDIKWM